MPMIRSGFRGDVPHGVGDILSSRALGFNSLTSVGGGLEVDVGGLDVGAFGVTVQRIRLMGRYFFGPNVSGFSAGIGVSF